MIGAERQTHEHLQNKVNFLLWQKLLSYHPLDMTEKHTHTQISHKMFLLFICFFALGLCILTIIILIFNFNFELWRWFKQVDCLYIYLALRRYAFQTCIPFYLGVGIVFIAESVCSTLQRATEILCVILYYSNNWKQHRQQ